MKNYEELIEEKVAKIKEIEDKIKYDLDKKKNLLSEIRELRHPQNLDEINSLIRVGSSCHVPQYTGGGFRFVVIKLEILHKYRFCDIDFDYVVRVEGELNNGRIFKYECPYKGGEFKYNNCSEMFPEDYEIIVKKY